MSFQEGEMVKFNGSEAMITSLYGRDLSTIKQNDTLLQNVPLHLLNKIEPPPASAEEAIISVLKSVEAHLASIDATLKKMCDG
jgi:hypothetical protein